MSKKIDFSYINKNNKKVSGSAAFLHHVYSVKGGVQAYNDDIGGKYIEKFIESVSDEIQEDIEMEAKKNKFKIIK